MSDQQLERKILTALLATTKTSGFTNREIRDFMGGGDKSKVNSILYAKEKENVVAKVNQYTPYRWYLIPLKKEESSKSDSPTNSKIIRLLILVDLGNVHDCFDELKNLGSESEAWAFADFAYNVSSYVTTFVSQAHECSAFAQMWVSMTKDRRVFKCLKNISDAADALLIRELHSAINSGRLEKGGKSEIYIVSKDKGFAPTIDLVKSMGYSITAISNTSQLLEHI